MEITYVIKPVVPTANPDEQHIVSTGLLTKFHVLIMPITHHVSTSSMLPS